MVLAILIHVPRLDAAPTFPKDSWAGAFDRASNFLDDHVGGSDRPGFETGSSTPMNLEPGTDRYRRSAHFVPSDSRGYYAVQYANRQLPHHPGNDHEARALGHYGQPTGFDLNEPPSSPSWPRNVGDEGADHRLGQGSTYSYSALDRGASSSNAARHAGEVMDSAAFPVGPLRLNIHSWSDKDPEAVFASTEWPQLDEWAKAAALEAFGKTVFSMASFDKLPWLVGAKGNYNPGTHPREATQLQRKLVAEYLKVRFESHADYLKVKFGFHYDHKFEIYLDAGLLPKTAGFFKAVPQTVKKHEGPLDNALKHFGEDPAQSFVLGDFTVRFTSESQVTRDSLWKKLFNQSHPTKELVFNAVALGPDGTKIYLGKARFRKLDS